MAGRGGLFFFRGGTGRGLFFSRGGTGRFFVFFRGGTGRLFFFSEAGRGGFFFFFFRGPGRDGCFWRWQFFWRDGAKSLHRPASCPCKALKMFRVFPSNGTGKRSRFCTAGWERDGKAGRQKVDGMGWELTISRWDGNGREIKRSGNKSGNRSGNKSGNKLGNKSGDTSGNTSACREAQKSFRGFHHNYCFLCALYV